MWLFALFVAIPLIEIALFIQVGGIIGMWLTLLIVVLTALLGTQLVRSQGAMAMGEIRKSFEDLRDPSEPLVHGAMILFAGALLLTPGFFTDACGFALLVPGIRSRLFHAIRQRVHVAPMHAGRPQQRARADDIIDGEFEEVDPAPQATHRPTGSPSGWTRH